MRMHRMGSGVLAAALLCWAANVDARVACPTDIGGVTPYPKEATTAVRKGVVVVKARIDVCGRVAEAGIAKGVGDQALEDALVQAAHGWVLAPDGSDPLLPAGSTVMPGAIEIPIVLGWKDGELPPFHLLQWSRARVPAVDPLPSGDFPGYVKDPMPIDPASYAQIMTLLAEYGERLSPPGEAIKSYGVDDGLMGVQWEVFDEGFDFAPAVVRFRWVSDGKHTFRVAAVLCEATDPSACAKLDQMLARLPRQPADPPAPTPPIEARRLWGI